MFHPEAIQLSEKTRVLANLLHTTAIDGIFRQFGLCLGPTREQAELVWSSGAKHNDSRERQKRLLACFRLLKGVKQKGALRATVIRAKREDFTDCQKKMAEDEKEAFEEAKRGLNPKESIAALTKLKTSVYSEMSSLPNDVRMFLDISYPFCISFCKALFVKAND